ncbi:ImmA/IrrE family metallo-endopeptidase [Fusicatenibacter sp. CLA-AA-H241]|nr:ImmA/IrrE family metallo-endopeptidase [Oliverpabstia intestinalis]MCC2195380.1 ImmA/IrrE family metallo-endopeptidase [Oliverpabstia intestinalis]
MNSYEILLSEASENGLVVKEKPLKYNNGRIKGSRVAIRQDLSTSVEKACVLAEELGHHYTSYGNILDQSDTSNRKQELRARAWAYNKQIGLLGLIKAYEHGCRNRFEIAEYLEVTEEVLEECLSFYQNKYGVCTNVDNYVVYFIPNLVIMKKM